MTIRVLMLEDRASGASTTYAKGSQYDLPEATAALYIHNRWATYVSGDLVPNDAVPVSAQIDPVTGGIELLQSGERVYLDRSTAKRNRIVKNGLKLVDVVSTVGWTRTGAGTAYSVSAEWSRRNSHSLKVDMSSASADAIFYWSNATGVSADPDDKLLSLDVYIPELVNSDTVGGVTINVFVSNATSYAAPGTLWTFNSNYLRQGINELRMCGKDADGTSGAYRGAGTLPFGCTKAGASGGASPLNWSNPIKYVQVQISYSSSNKRTFYFDEIRTPEKIKPFLCIGFDATCADSGDSIFTDRIAPFLKEREVPCYFTTTWAYDGALQGSADDLRKEVLFNDYGWDAINHSWSHGAGQAGKLFSSGNSVVVSGGGTLATLTTGTPHQWTVGTPVFVSVTGATGASSAGVNGVFTATVTGASTVTYPITSGVDGTATGTIKVGTRFIDIMNSVAQPNQPIILPAAQLAALMKHEVRGLQIYPLSKGWWRGQNFMAYPNNSPPDMRLMEVEAPLAGIKLARGSSGTTCRVSAFGVDNPYNLPSTDMSSTAAVGSTIADITNALQGAINRGEGLITFGHYLRDESLDAVVDINSPPGMNGNPAAPGSSSLDLWWYAGQFEKFVDTVAIPLRDVGEIDIVSVVDLVDQLTP